jgi:hypothetical protein
MSGKSPTEAQNYGVNVSQRQVTMSKFAIPQIHFVYMVSSQMQGEMLLKSLKATIIIIPIRKLVSDLSCLKNDQ